MKSISAFLLIALTFLLSGCGLKPVVPNKITDVKFGKIDIFKGTIVMNMGLQIDNPNNFAIMVHGLELNVMIDSVSIGTVSVEDKIKIEKDTQLVYRVNVNAKLTDVINGIPTILNAIDNKKANATVNGFITAGAFGLKKKFPVNIKQEAVETSQQ